MNNQNYLLLIIILTQSTIFAQNDYDRFWLTGDSQYLDLSTETGGCLIDFKENTPKLTPFDLPGEIADGSYIFISNASGVPLFISNGCLISNFKEELLIDSDSMNAPGPIWEAQCNWLKAGYPAHLQGMLTLPVPNDTNKYEIFHLWANGVDWNSKSLMHTSIDMSLGNGRGGVLSKNNKIMTDSLLDGICAVRHGNGRDWWVFNTSIGSNRAYLTLLDPAGVQPTKVVTTLGHWDGRPSGGYMEAQSVFSPDGNLFARIDMTNGLQIAHFDRCTGEFFCPVRIPWVMKAASTAPFDYLGDYASVSGVSFSPNSRFLYVSTGYRLFQFDLWAKDWVNSWEMIGEYDGFLAPFPTSFFLQRLAPNGKIYMNASNGMPYLHVINKPNEKGTACQFEQHGLKLLTDNGFAVPNIPNFRLFDFANSPCDSLGIDAPEGSEPTIFNQQLQIFPNPANELAIIQLPVCQNGRLAIFEVTGQLLGEINEVGNKTSIELDTNFWPSGIYIVTLFSENNKPISIRFVVLHH